jgi:hypothetical protein
MLSATIFAAACRANGDDRGGTTGAGSASSGGAATATTDRDEPDCTDERMRKMTPSFTGNPGDTSVSITALRDLARNLEWYEDGGTEGPVIEPPDDGATRTQNPRVRIDPEICSNKLTKDQLAAGRFIARIAHKRGPHWKRVGLEEKHTVYWWVRGDLSKPNTGVMSLFVDLDGNSPRITVVPFCSHPNGGGFSEPTALLRDLPHADDPDCVDWLAKGGNVAGATGIRSHTNGPWINCPEGCCTIIELEAANVAGAPKRGAE